MARRRDLKGQLALVTGGGRGIGRAISLELARAGARIAIADLDPAAARAVAEEIRASGGDARSDPLDVTERADFDSLVARLEVESGPVDILINNAGLMTLGSFGEHGALEDVTQIEVNLLGVANGMRAVLDRMRARKRGHIVNIASLAGRVGTPYAAIYSATKHAVIGLTESVRGELFGSGVDFTYVMPTLVRTELIAGAGRPLWPPVASPEDVARAVRHALEHNVLDVYVPKSGRLSVVLPVLLPRALVDWVGRRLRVDQMFARVDAAKRAAYIERTTRPPKGEAEAPSAAGVGTAAPRSVQRAP